jgi:HEAT repeat protein
LKGDALRRLALAKADDVQRDIKEPDAVVAAMKELGPVAEEEAIRLLRDRNPGVAANAARILETIGTQKCLIELRRLSNDPRDPSTAATARIALDAVLARVKQAKAAAAATQPATRP